MFSVALVNGYLCANVLLIAAALLLAGVRRFSARLAQPFSYRHLLNLGYLLSAAAVILPFVNTSFDHERLMPHTVQVFSSASMKDRGHAAADDHQIVVSMAPARTAISLSTAARVAGFVLAFGFLVAGIRIAMDAWTVARIIARAHPLRRHGALSVLASDSARVPFSFWIPRRFFIVVPSALVLHPGDLRMALRHEAQHHRQGDTKVLYLYQLALAWCYWNPAARRLVRQILELQEFACDEAVVAAGRTRVQDYCRCLLRMAETASAERLTPLRAGMAGGDAQVLARRIESALTRPNAHGRKPYVMLAGAAAVATLAAFSIALAAPIQDHRISMADAQRMATVAQQHSAFPITLNERVLEQLNVLLGTPDGRAYMRASLARMEAHRALISDQIARYGLPAELIAIPLVESGYRNLPASNNPRTGAGLWMFIESTARRYGLELTPAADDRLDVPRETEAAMRLLSELHRGFNDWNLALLAYNTGHDRVERAIRETGSRDAWHLIRHGYENDSNYLPRSLAMMLILKNPSVMDEG